MTQEQEQWWRVEAPGKRLIGHVKAAPGAMRAAMPGVELNPNGLAICWRKPPTPAPKA